MEMMMDESETKQAALAHFDRTPIAPEHVRVLVQSGTEWYWHELPAREIWSNLEAFIGKIDLGVIIVYILQQKFPALFYKYMILLDFMYVASDLLVICGHNLADGRRNEC